MDGELDRMLEEATHEIRVENPAASVDYRLAEMVRHRVEAKIDRRSDSHQLWLAEYSRQAVAQFGKEARAASATVTGRAALIIAKIQHLMQADTDNWRSFINRSDFSELQAAIEWRLARGE